MAKYSIKAGRAAVGVNLTWAVFNATATPRRVKLYEFTVGFGAPVGDNAYTCVWQRFTAAGTTTAVTPQPLDPADAVALTAGGTLATVEPTYVANQFLFTLDMNQRSTFRWVAPPYGEILTPATNANGLGFYTTVAGSTPAADIDVKIEEQ